MSRMLLQHRLVKAVCVMQAARATWQQKVASFLLALSLASLFNGYGTELFSVPRAEAAAGINHTINYQGKVASTNGAAVANGAYNLRFKIFTASSGGVPVWTETWNSSTSQVTMTGGLFSVSLGTYVTMTGSVDFNSDSLYLQVEFDPANAGTYPETFSPRRRFSSVPYAFNAEKINGLSSSQLLRADQNATASGTITITKAGVGLKVTGTASGRDLFAQTSLRSSGTLVVRGTATFQSYTSCAVISTDSAGNLGCGSGTSFNQAAADARYVNTSGDTMTGGLLIQNGGTPSIIDSGLLLEIAGTASGRSLRATDSLMSSGTLVVRGATTLQGSVKMSSLVSCTALQTDSLGALSCNNAQYLATSTGSLANAFKNIFIASSTGALKASFSAQFLQSSTGSLKAYMLSLNDARYVNAAGDSMTGGLLIKNGNAGATSVDAGLLLEVAGTASGRVLHAQDKIEGSGSLTIDGAVTFKNLVSCGALQTSSNGALSCGASLSVTSADARYVKKQGDTMTGALTIKPSAGNTALGLAVNGVISGSAIRILSTSGLSAALVIQAPNTKQIADLTQWTLTGSRVRARITKFGEFSNNGNGGQFNELFGSGAGFRLNSAAIGNTAIGYRSLSSQIVNSSGSFNVAVGMEVMRQNRGNYNTGIGYEAMYLNSAGSDNIAIGSQAFYINNNGNKNTVIGNYAMNTGNTTNGENTAIGYNAFGGLTGSGNVAVGSWTGLSLTNGSGVVLLGSYADGADNLRNAAAIGYRSLVTRSNSIVLGSGANVGIGTSAPKAKLEVVGVMSGSSLVVTGLKACTSLQTDSNGALACGSTNLNVATGDARYVNTSGDTMTGGLLIQGGGSPGTITPGLLLEVQGTAFVETLLIGAGATAPYPGQKLSLRSSQTTGTAIASFSNGSDEGLYIYHTGTDGISSYGGANVIALSATYLGGGSYRSLALVTSDIARIFIKASGEVGVGTTTPKATFDVRGSMSGSSLSISSLFSCSNLQTDTSGALSCNNAQYLATSTGALANAFKNIFIASSTGALKANFGSQFVQSSTGSLRTLFNALYFQSSTGALANAFKSIFVASSTGSLRNSFDNRYVNTSGDTMTGALTIKPNAGNTALGLIVNGVMSGAALRILSASATSVPVAIKASTVGRQATDLTQWLLSGSQVRARITRFGEFSNNGPGSIGFNEFFGSGAGMSMLSGFGNTAMGNQSMRFTTTGANNTAIGYQSLWSNTTGGYNTAIGHQALVNNTVGIGNIAIGDIAMANGTIASYNIGIGNNAILNVARGTYNTALGHYTGASFSAGTGVLLLGSLADVTTDNLINAVAIGYQSLVSTSNSVILGSGANVGIGTSAPKTKLEVVGVISGSSLTVTGLKACALLQTNTNGALSCNNAQYLATSTGALANAFKNIFLASSTGALKANFGSQFVQSSTGSLRTLFNALYFQSSTGALANAFKNIFIASSTGALKTSFGSQFVQSSTGSLKAYFRTLDDNRFVNTSGDTMTGALIIKPSAGSTALGLAVNGIISGSTLRILATSTNVTDLAQWKIGSTVRARITKNGEFSNNGPSPLVGSIANEFFGSGAGIQNLNGAENSGFGNGALFSNTTGNDNAAFGMQTLYANVGGGLNTAIGNFALNSSTNANNNTAVGYYALGRETLGGNNTAVGYYALNSLTTGNLSAALGYQAGANSYQTGTGTLFLGSFSSGAVLNNAAAIGYKAVVRTSNSIVLGSGANVGIGISAPKAKLEVVGVISGSSLTVTGLKACAALQTDTNGALSCNNAQYLATSTGALANAFKNIFLASSTGSLRTSFGFQFVQSSTGSLKSLFDTLYFRSSTGSLANAFKNIFIASSTGALKTSFSSQFVQSSTGSLKAYFRTLDDNRFVNTSGDTMTGALVILKTSGTSTGNTLVVDTKGLVYDASNKRVGIGTASPKTALEVIGALSGSSLAISNGGGTNYIMGSLGIGTASPTGTLHITNSAQDNWRFETGNPRQLAYYFGTETNARWSLDSNSQLILNSTPSGTAAGNGAAVGMAGQRILSFYTSNSTALTERARFDVNGNFMINTGNSSARLAVVGTVSGSALTVTGLKSCESLKTDLNGSVSCATGLALSSLDARYVNTSGDTMTGALTIKPSAGTSALGLAVNGTISGSALRILATSTNTADLTQWTVGSTVRARITKNGEFSNSGKGTGAFNELFGSGAGLSLTTGINNVAMGTRSLQSLTTGNNNTANGFESLLSLTTGVTNTAFGVQSMRALIAGTRNTGLGAGTLYQNIEGSNNTAVGYGALINMTVGNLNTALGYNAGSSLSFFGAGTGTGNLFLGSYSDYQSVGAINNATAIGYKTMLTTSNTLILGSGANVGIGTSAPKAKLDVVGVISGSSLTVTGLKACAALQTDSAGALSCGTALSQTSADARYVKKQGDTMTGALVILKTSGTSTGNTLVVDTKGLVYDATNKRVGVGTATPSAQFEVSMPAGGNQTGAYIYGSFENVPNKVGLVIQHTLPAGGTPGGTLLKVLGDDQNDLDGNAADSDALLQVEANGDIGIGSAPDSAGSVMYLRRNLDVSSTALLTLKHTSPNGGTQAGYLIQAYGATVNGTTLAFQMNAIGTTYFREKVGIGTTTPGSKLSVSGAVLINPNGNIGSTAAKTALEVKGTISGALLTLSAPGLSTINGKLSVGASGAQNGNMLSVTGSGYISGRLGIGTAAPTASLHILYANSSTTGANGIVIDNSASGLQGVGSSIKFQSTNASNTTSQDTARIYAQYGSSRKLVLQVATAADTWSDALTVTSDGLQVPTSFQSANTGTGNAAIFSNAFAGRQDQGVGIKFVGMNGSNTLASAARLFATTANGGRITLQNLASGTDTWTDTLSATNGSVGIGTITPDAKLEVIGTLSGSALTVTGLKACTALQTDTNGALSCASALTQTSTDARYVNTSGDTMTGALTIKPSAGNTALGLAVNGIISGSAIRILSTSGLSAALVIQAPNTKQVADLTQWTLTGSRVRARITKFGEFSNNGNGGQYNELFGSGAGLRLNSAAIGNTAIGYRALSSRINSSGSYNVAVGMEVMRDNRGNYNTGIGSQALYSNTAGSDNIAIGSQALFLNINGNRNTVLGNYAMGIGSFSNGDNTAIGFSAINTLTGSGNVAIGAWTGQSIVTAGSGIVLVGAYADAADNLRNAAAIGYEARVTASDSLVLGSGANVGIGTSAPKAKLEVVGVMSGSSLTVTGLKACTALQTDSAGALSCGAGGLNTALADARYVNTSGDTMTGALSIKKSSGTATGNILVVDTNGFVYDATNKRVGIGTSGPTASLDVIGDVTMHSLVYIAPALLVNTSSNRVAINKNAATTSLDVAGTISGALVNVSSGYQMKGVTILSTKGSQNFFGGEQAANNVISGSQNTALGYQALGTAIASTFNIAIGYQAMKGQINTAVGSENIAIGAQTLLSLRGGSANIGIGDSALVTTSSGSRNIGIGVGALSDNALGNNNVAIGDSALYNNNAGWNNTGLGYSAGQALLTGSGNTFLGALADAGTSALKNATAIGYKTFVSASNSLILGSGANVGIGTSAPKTKLEVVGVMSGSSLTVTGLKACTALQTDSAGALSCASASGLTQTAADARYVNTSGDTMTGGLLIVSGNSSATIDAGLLLEIAGTASGRVLHAQDQLRSSGSLVVEGVTTLQNTLKVMQSGGVPGTDEVQIYHDGASGTIESKDGDLNLLSASHIIRTPYNFSVGDEMNLTNAGVVKNRLLFTQAIDLYSSDVSLAWTASTNIGGGSSGDTGLSRLSAATLKVTDGSTGMGNLSAGTFSGGALRVLSTSATSVPVTFQASTAAKQTTDLTQWLLSGSQIRARINKYGEFTYGGPGTLGGNELFGSGAGRRINLGSNNTAVGNSALLNLTTGSNNVAIGTSALQASTNGTYNTAVGFQSLLFVTSGAGNATLGARALYLNTGSQNTAVGYEALKNNTVNGNNVGLGYQAGFQATGTGGLYLGAFSSGSILLMNATAIGYKAAVTASNTIRLGSGANVIIGGKGTANTKLEVQGTISGSALTVTGLKACTALQTDSAGALSCGSGGGLTQTNADSRYVNASGDTMTGALVILKNAGTATGNTLVVDTIGLVYDATHKSVAIGTNNALGGGKLEIHTTNATEGGLIVTPFADNTAAIFGFTNAAGSYNLSINALGAVGQTANAGSVWNGGMIVQTSGVKLIDAGYTTLPVTITPYNSSTVPLISKGAVGQSANIQEWQNSAGNALAFITPSGSGSFKAIAIGKTPVNGRPFEVVGAISGATLTVSSLRNCDSIDTNSAGVLVCGTDAGGSSGLSLADGDARYVNAAGDTMTGGLLITSTAHSPASIDAGLLLEVGGTMSGRTIRAQDSITSSGTVAIGLKSDMKGLVIREAASQSVNPFEISNSAGSAIFTIDANGSMSLTGDRTIDGSTGLRFGMAGTARLRVDSSGTVGIGDSVAPNGSAQLLVQTNNYTNRVTQVIMGTPNQTADLLQFQTYAGTVLASFTRSGALSIAPLSSSTSTPALSVQGTISGSTVNVSRALQIDGVNVLTGQSYFQSYFFGSGAGIANAAFYNTGMGFNALKSNTTGGVNAAFGYTALQANTTGSSNTAVGSEALVASVTGDFNTGLGNAALVTLTKGSYNTGVGGWALRNLDSGSSNAALGTFAGFTPTTGTGNLFLGASADASIADIRNATAIGYKAIVSANNTLVLGSGANVIIGSKGTANTKLEVQGTISGSTLTISGLKNCDTIDTNSAGVLVCGTDSGGGGGLALVDADARYVRRSGGTMTGALRINWRGAGSGGTLLSVAGTMSGKALTVMGSGSGLAPLIATSMKYGAILMGTGALRGGTGAIAPNLYVANKIPTAPIATAVAATTPKSVMAVGRTVYVTTASRLQIFDVSNPAVPVFVGSGALSNTGNPGRGLDVQGRYAYVSEFDRVEIFDISNASAPVRMSIISGSINPSSLDAQGQYLYVSISGAVRIYDISNPANPLLAGTMTTSAGTMTAIHVVGRYAYMVLLGKIYIGDISVASNATLIAATTVGTSANNIYVQGRYAYIVDGSGTPVLNIVDVSNPSNPTRASSLSLSGVGTVNGIFVQGRTAYVASTTNGLLVVDVSDPSSPSLQNSPALTGNNQIYVQGRYAYSIRNNALDIYDLGGAYIQQLEAGGLEVATLTVRNSIQGLSLDIRGVATIGRGFLANAASAVSMNSSGSTAFTVRHMKNGTGVLVVASGSLAPSLVLDVYNPSQTAAHIRFGSQGVYDTWLVRPAANTLKTNALFYAAGFSGATVFANNVLSTSGTLVINGNARFKANSAVTVMGQLSGASLRAQNYLASSGVLVITGNARFKGTNTVSVSGTLSGANILANNNLASSGVLVIGGNARFKANSAVTIMGQLSGASLRAQRYLASSGVLVIAGTSRFKNTLTVVGTVSGAALRINSTSGSLVTVAIRSLSTGRQQADLTQWLMSGAQVRARITKDGQFSNDGGIAGSYSEFFGSGAGMSQTTGTYNTGIGQRALAAVTTGYQNVAIGTQALRINTTGTNNVAIGVQTLWNNTTGGENTAIGLAALSTNSAGYNVAVGNYTLMQNNTGINNVALGYSALTNGTYASNNTAMGYNSGLANLRGSGITLLGAFTNVGVNNLLNASAIGFGSVVTSKNTISIGSGANVSIGSGGQLGAKLGIYTEDSFNNPALKIQSHETTAGQNLFMIISDNGTANNTVMRVQADGNAFSDGSFTGGGADYAEYFFSATPDLQQGELVCIDVTKKNTVRRCDRSADSNVIGIVSSPTQAAFIGNKFKALDGLPVPGTVLVGLIGQLRTKVIVESGATIRTGDQLTPASIPGYARRAQPGDSTVGVALEPLDGPNGTKGEVQVLISRRNQSLTAEAVNDQILGRIKDMNIEDDVTAMVQSSLTKLNVDDNIKSEVERQFQSASIDSRISLLQRQIDEVRSGQRSAGSGQQLTTFSSTGSLRASTLELDDTLVTGGDARIGGDLYLDGTLSVSDLFVPGVMKVDGSLEANTLTIESGATLKGPVTVYQRLEMASGSTLVFATGSTLDISTLLVKNALEVLGTVTIRGLASFFGNVDVHGTLSVSSNQAGTAMIPAGETGVTIRFSSGAYITTPSITASSDDFAAWRIRNKSQTGFVIQIASKADHAILFDWHAFGMVSASTGAVVSSGSSSSHKKLFPVDGSGIPTSSNVAWNNCIRNQTVLDSEGQPLSCDRYHNGNVWTHPDLEIEFTWNTATTPATLVLPLEFEAAFMGDADLTMPPSDTDGSSSSSEEAISSSSSSAPDEGSSSSSSSVESFSSSSEASSQSSSSEESSSSSSSDEGSSSSDGGGGEVF